MKDGGGGAYNRSGRNAKWATHGHTPSGSRSLIVCLCAVVMPVRSDPVTLCHNLDSYHSVPGGPTLYSERCVCPVCFITFKNRQPCSCKYQRRLEISVLFLECDLGGLTGLPNLVLLKWGYHSLPSRIFKGTSWDYHMRSPGRRYFQFFHSLGPWVCDRARHGWRFASA